MIPIRKAGNHHLKCLALAMHIYLAFALLNSDLLRLMSTFYCLHFLNSHSLRCISKGDRHISRYTFYQEKCYHLTTFTCGIESIACPKFFSNNSLIIGSISDLMNSVASRSIGINTSTHLSLSFVDWKIRLTLRGSY